MQWLKIDSRVDPRELLSLGVRLHGHLGPFLVAGIRAGLLGLRLLGSPGYSGISAEVETGTTPPLSCMVDGLQVSTGCTIGKGNLRVKGGRRPAVTLSAAGRSARIALREEILRALLDGGANEDQAEWLLKAPEEELFTWELLPLS